MLYGFWAIAIVIAVFGALIAAFVPKDTHHGYQWVHWCNVILWTLGPPIWFLIDATLRIQPDKKVGLNDWEKFFYDSAAKFWAAVLALLFVIYKKGDWLK